MFFPASWPAFLVGRRSTLLLALSSGLALAADVDLPFCQSCGQSHVLSPFADRKRKLIVWNYHLGALFSLAQLDRVNLRRG